MVKINRGFVKKRDALVRERPFLERKENKMKERRKETN